MEQVALDLFPKELGLNKKQLAEAVAAFAPAADPKGPMSYEDAFQVGAGCHLSGSLDIGLEDAAKFMAEHGIELHNRTPVVKVRDDGTVVTKVRLDKFRGRMISMMDKCRYVPPPEDAGIDPANSPPPDPPEDGPPKGEPDPAGDK